jgi:hypothetical protein
LRTLSRPIPVLGKAAAAIAFVAVVAGLAAWSAGSPTAPGRLPLASDVAEASVAPSVAPSPSAPAAPSSSSTVDQPPKIVPRDLHLRPGRTLRQAAPGLLWGARDPQHRPIFVSGRGGAAHGHIAINPSGAFQYTPDPGFEGVDAVTWTASDGSLTTTVTTKIVVDGTAPRVVDRYPAAGATGVPVDAPAWVEFDDQMWTGWTADVVWAITVRDLVTGRLVPPVSVTTFGASGKITLELAPLVGSRTYRVSVTSRMRDLAGNPFAGTSWTFRTEDDTAPRIVEPIGSTIAIHPSDPIRLTFDKPLRADTVTQQAIDFRVATGYGSDAVPFALAYDPLTLTVTIRPLDDLTVGATYRVRVRQKIKDVAGSLTGFAGFDVIVRP